MRLITNNNIFLSQILFFVITSLIKENVYGFIIHSNLYSTESVKCNMSKQKYDSERRQVMKESLGSILSMITLPSTVLASESKEITGFITKSGLKYIDLKEGYGKSPLYGQLCTFSYKASIKIAGSDKKPERFDEDKAYLTKHGNGRIVPGLDEGLHTMKVGGVRRIIIPPKLGYVTSGLGPLPSGFLGRRKLSSLLDQMIEKKGGQLIFEVQLLSVIDDEADQGYYNDDTLTPEEFNTLRDNVQKSFSESRKAKELVNQI